MIFPILDEVCNNSKMLDAVEVIIGKNILICGTTLFIKNPFELKSDLDERLVFGGYPNVLNIKNRDERVKYINELADNYLYKDILEIENIKYHTKLRNLLRLLAFQIGSEVSIQELANNLQLNQHDPFEEEYNLHNHLGAD
mgnify:CR=1 FL=1